MSGAWGRWVERANRREPAHAVALVRVVYGLALAAHMGWMWVTGAWRWVWLSPADGGLVALNRTWLDRVGGPTPGLVEGLVVVSAGAGLLLALGCFTPVAAFVAALSWSVLTDLGVNAGGSYDFLGGNVFFLLLFAGSGEVWAVDAWRSRLRARGPALVPVWPRWLMVWQLVVMYDATVWQKVSSGWVPGGSADALWYILQQPTWQRIDMQWLAAYFRLTQVATLGTWVFEHAAPLLVLAAWYRETRTRRGWLRAQFNRVDFRVAYLAVGVAMHIGIEATMEVGAFNVFTLGMYAACFSGEEVRRGLGASPQN